ncbi:MAG: type ISP restriction/modification enzyme [Nostoc sp.]
MSVENTERIKQQNETDISVIMANPPYNAKQENFNDRNANLAYPEIDKRIKETYIKFGTAQNQIVLYDMYVRFLRWASDRLSQNGIVALITNSSFIDSKTFDGFRKVVSDEFSEIYIIDLGGNIRTGDKSGSVFGVKVGTAISFMVKKRGKTKVPCLIFYTKVAEDSAEAKLNFLASTPFEKISFLHINPDEKSNWINLSDNDFDCLIPLISKDVKAGQGKQAIFQLFSSGVKTQRDEWVYDFSKSQLENRMKFFVDVYERKRRTSEELGFDIKGNAELNRYLELGISKSLMNIR